MENIVLIKRDWVEYVNTHHNRASVFSETWEAFLLCWPTQCFRFYASVSTFHFPRFPFHFTVAVQRCSHNITSSSFSLLLLISASWQTTSVSNPPADCPSTSVSSSSRSFLCCGPHRDVERHHPLSRLLIAPFLFLLTSLLLRALLAIWQRCDKTSAPPQIPGRGRSSWGRDPGMTWGRQWRHGCWEPRPWWRPAGPNLEKHGGVIGRLNEFRTIFTF